jgi:hypothetical protein
MDFGLHGGRLTDFVDPGSERLTIGFGQFKAKLHLALVINSGQNRPR